MQLSTYLSEHKISLSEFARRLQVRNARTVQRWTKHGKMPSASMMARIAATTAGAVQPNDFFVAEAE